MNVLRAILAITLLALAASAARSDDYPSRPIHIIVPYTPGASTDLLARATADLASKTYGMTFVIESRPGAGTALGTRVVKAAAADGYTILFQATNFLNNLHTLKEPGYAIDDFTSVALLGQTAYVLLIPSDIPAKNLKEFVDYARARNGQLNYASLGHGTRQQLLPEHLKTDAGFDWKEIPYKGGIEGIAALLGGQVQGYFATVSLAQAQSQQPGIREIAVAAEERTRFLPDIPTFKEQGFPGIVDKTWFALFVCASTPQPIIDKLRRVFDDVVKTPGYQAALDKISIDPLVTTHAQFAADMLATSAKLAAEQLQFGIEKQ
jgi:tripartite-type tricarboxylate transporter receptor subunit TctC